MRSTVVVTGINGFTAPYVRSALERKGHRVLGISNGAVSRPEDRQVDLLDYAALVSYIAQARPDYVIHLAAVSFVAHEDAAELYQVNLLGTLNLLQALASSNAKLRKAILASSANVYGRPRALPVEESAAMAPVNHYGVSKCAMELMARLWFDRFPILIVRPFNYTGVGQARKFVVPKVAEHFRTGSEEIDLGDVSVTREFMDVRDVAEAYARLLESNASSETVNICCGRGYTVAAVVDFFRSISGRSVSIRTTDNLQRSNEIPELIGSPEKLNRLLGSAISFRGFEETAAWMLLGRA